MSTFVIYISIIAVLDLAASICAKMYAIKGSSIYMLGTIFFLGAAGFFFAKSLKFGGLAMVNITWIVLSVVIVSVASYFFFHESLSRIQILGIFISLIGMILVNIE